MSLTIASQQSQADRMVFKLKGRLDTHTTPQLDEVLDPLLAGTTKLIVFDFADLEYISSAGLRAVFKTNKVLGARGGRSLVVNLQPPVQKVFDIVKAMPKESVFTSWDELDGYLDAMQKKARSGDDE